MCDEYLYDWCYECTGYGNHYCLDKNGGLVDACIEFPFNKNNKKEED